MFTKTRIKKIKSYRLLNFKDVPDAPGKPKISDVIGGSAKVTWTAPASDGGSKIEEFIVEQLIEGGSAWKQVKTTSKFSCDVTGLMSDVSYTYRVCAVNKAGNGAYSAPSLPVTAIDGTRTSDDAPKLALEMNDVTVVAPKTAKFEVALSKKLKPEPKARWFKDGREIFGGE